MQSSSKPAISKAALSLDLTEEIEAEARAAAEAVRARRRVDVLLAAIAAPPVAVDASPSSAHMTRAEYARRSHVSEATISRLIRAGLPTVPVGTTVRIDAAEADAWRRSRGTSTPTRANTKPLADVEVDDVLAIAGLRLVGTGGRR